MDSDEEEQPRRRVRVRMIHVCPPTLVTTDSANFRAVVQHLTGQASSCCCGCKSSAAPTPLGLSEEDRRPALLSGIDDAFSDISSTTTPHSSSSSSTPTAVTVTATGTKHSSLREEEKEERGGVRKKAKAVGESPALGLHEQIGSDDISRMLSDMCSSSPSSSSCDMHLMHGSPFSHTVLGFFDMDHHHYDDVLSRFPLYLPHN